MDLLDDSLRHTHSFTRRAHTLLGARAPTHTLGHAQARLRGRGGEGRGRALAVPRRRGVPRRRRIRAVHSPLEGEWYKSTGTLSDTEQTVGGRRDREAAAAAAAAAGRHRRSETERQREKTSDPGPCRASFLSAVGLKTRPDLLQHRDHVRKQKTHSNVSHSR